MGYTKNNIVKFLVLLPVFVFILLGIGLISQPPDSESFRRSIGPPDLDWVDKTLRSLTLREQIGQLIHVRIRGEFLNRESRDYTNLIRDIEDYKVGGMVLFAGNIYESVHLINDLQQRSDLPLLVASDFERGASFRIEDTTSFPWAMAVGATGSEEYAYSQGMITAKEARALGVHWIFAPVLDVNNNPENPVINIRAYGEDPVLVAGLGTAFIRGARTGGVLTTGKHFPGHGDTSTDTHIGLAVVASDIERLHSVELVPFISAIEAGVDAIMTAHVAMPEVTKDPEVPATLSPAILTGLLREQLQFKGLIVTDAMEMGGIANRYWCGLAASLAVEAGADIVLLPTDVEVAINEIERAVERGDISASRIEASARRILEAKSRVGLVDTRLVPTDNLAETIGTPESKQTAQEIADHSITAIKDDTHLLPVNPVYAPKIYSLVLDSGLDTSPGFIFRNELRKYYPSMTSEWANSRIPNEQIDRIRRQAANSEMIICSTFARLSSGRDISAIPKEQQTIIKILIDTGKPLILIAFGNPYVLERFPRIGTYLCTFSDSEVSQIAAAKALSGAVPIAGRMPVSIPGHAATGDGLQIDPLEMKLKSKPEGTGNPSDITLINKVNNFINKDYLDNDDALCIVAGLKGFKILDICMDANGLTTGSNPDDSVRHKMQPELHSPDGLGTILLSMLSYESGRLLLDVPAVDYLPEFRGSDIGQTTVSDLLKDFQANHRINDADLSNENILNEIILRSCGSIDRLLSELPRDWIVSERTVLDADYVAGAPIWSQHSVSAEQIPVFLQTLLNKGIYEYDRIFKPATIDRFTNPGRGIQALGWQKPASGHWTGEIYSPGSFGYTDKSGLFVWVDPQTEFFIVLDFKTEAASPDTGHWSKAYESICNTILNHIQNR